VTLSRRSQSRIQTRIQGQGHSSTQARQHWVPSRPRRRPVHPIVANVEIFPPSGKHYRRERIRSRYDCQVLSSSSPPLGSRSCTRAWASAPAKALHSQCTLRGIQLQGKSLRHPRRHRWRRWAFCVQAGAGAARAEASRARHGNSPARALFARRCCLTTPSSNATPRCGSVPAAF
jgi:hypothetical protein